MKQVLRWLDLFLRGYAPWQGKAAARRDRYLMDQAFLADAIDTWLEHPSVRTTSLLRRAALQVRHPEGFVWWLGRGLNELDGRCPLCQCLVWTKDGGGGLNGKRRTYERHQRDCKRDLP